MMSTAVRLAREKPECLELFLDPDDDPYVQAELVRKHEAVHKLEQATQERNAQETWRHKHREFFAAKKVAWSQLQVPSEIQNSPWFGLLSSREKETLAWGLMSSGFKVAAADRAEQDSADSAHQQRGKKDEEASADSQLEGKEGDGASADSQKQNKKGDKGESEKPEKVSAASVSVSAGKDKQGEKGSAVSQDFPFVAREDVHRANVHHAAIAEGLDLEQSPVPQSAHDGPGSNAAPRLPAGRYELGEGDFRPADARSCWQRIRFANHHGPFAGSVLAFARVCLDR